MKRLIMTAVHRAMRIYWVFRRPRTQGVRAIALTPEGHVVLIRHSYVPGWHLPGGGRRRDEDPQAAMLRELREEIGLVSHGSVDFFSEYHQIVDFRRDRVSLFVVRDVVYAPRLSLEIDEIGEFAMDRLPAGTVPATCRRLAEFRGTAIVQPEWWMTRRSLS